MLCWWEQRGVECFLPALISPWILNTSSSHSHLWENVAPTVCIWEFWRKTKARKRAETVSAIGKEKRSFWGWWIFLLDLNCLYLSLLFVVSSYCTQDGSWADSACEMKFGYICKRKPLAEEPGEAEVTYPGCQKVSVKQKQQKVIACYFHSHDNNYGRSKLFWLFLVEPRKLLISYVLILLRLKGNLLLYLTEM